jgi:hypothetical protein
MSESAVTDQTAAAAAEPKIEAPAVETPKAEPLKSEAAKVDVKSDIKTDIEASIASVIKSKFAGRPRASRYAVLAASITIAAALGSVVGALAGAALMRSEPATSIERTVTADALNTTLAQLSTDLSSLKAALDATAKTTSTQLSKISERVERAEKSQAEAAQKTARLLETPKSPAQIPAQVPTDVTGSIVEKQQVRPPIVEGWVIRDIFDGRAMVESRSHGIYEVGPGAPLPGVGKVEAVRRQDGRWVVVTPKGLIVSAR